MLLPLSVLFLKIVAISSAFDEACRGQKKWHNFHILQRKTAAFVTFVKEVSKKDLTVQEKLCYNQIIKYERTSRLAMRMKE